VTVLGGAVVSAEIAGGTHSDGTAKARPPAATTPVVAQGDQVAPLTRVVPPDLLAIAGHPVDDATLRKIAKLKGVQDTISADAGAIQLQDKRVNALAVDPSAFRAWTPPGTAQSEGLWAALATDKFVVSDTAMRNLGVQPGFDYSVVGREVLTVTMGGAGPLGLPGIDMLVSKKTGARLQLVPNLALMVNAPGVNAPKLAAQVKQVLGNGSTVLNLHDKKYEAGVQTAGSGRPATYLDLYRQSAAKWCPGMSWTVLAAIGQIESDHGRNAGMSSAGALGPMQFLPSTWKMYGVDGDADGKIDIMDPYDAVPSAAHYLCANGAAHGGRQLYDAIFQYNHADWYVQKVLNLAALYAKTYS
jgi:Transglycosylase SLT domain